MSGTPKPGACGDPRCYVLHADPANPIHPPWYMDSRALTVADLTRHDLGTEITVEGLGVGVLYAIHDDFHDGYPSRTLIVVTAAETGNGETDEWPFTDSDPDGYPKTMGTPVAVTL